MPRAEELLRLSKALGVTMEWLLPAAADGEASVIPDIPQPRSKVAIRKALAAARSAIDKAEDELDHS